MGLIFLQVSFDGRAPDLALIADKITELCSLPVIVEPSDADVKGTLYDQHGEIAFACAAQERLEISTYQPGAVRKFYDEAMDGVELPTEKFVQGLNEPAGTQTIYLTGFVGLETLMAVTLLALEALGGRPNIPISDEMRREYGRPITEADLLERRRQLVRQLRKARTLQLLFLPVTIPLFVLGLIVRLVTMPWRLRKAIQLTKEAIGKRDHQKFMSVLPDQVESVTADPAAHEKLDRAGLRHYTEALEALGFVHLTDYSVRHPDHPPSGRPPPFARLWMHPEHRCFAEVNQAFSNKKPTFIRCSLGSWLQDGWNLSTGDRELGSLYYAWRRPRSPWSWHPHLSPAELLAEHLRRRQRMIDSLGLAVVTELTVEAYFEKVRKNKAARHDVLRTKNMETIKAERSEYERAPIHEWSGDLPPNCWGRELSAK